MAKTKSCQRATFWAWSNEKIEPLWPLQGPHDWPQEPTKKVWTSKLSNAKLWHFTWSKIKNKKNRLWIRKLSRSFESFEQIQKFKNSKTLFLLDYYCLACKQNYHFFPEIYSKMLKRLNVACKCWNRVKKNELENIGMGLGPSRTRVEIN